MSAPYDDDSCAGMTRPIQEAFGRAAESLIEWVALSDAGGRILWLNAAARALVKCGAQLPAEFPCTDLQPEWACEVVQQEGIRAALRDGSWRGETAIWRTPGKESPVEQTLISAGTPEQPVIASFLRNIEHRKSEGLERIEHTNSFEAAIRASGQLLFHWDPATNDLVFASPTEQLTGYTMAELAGGVERLRQLLHPDDTAAFDREFRRAAQARAELEIEFRLQRPEGRYVVLQARGRFFLDRTGAFSQLAGLLSDVTAIWQTQEQLALAREKLENRLQLRLQEARDAADSVRRSKSELLSRMSHELRTPLNAILGFTQLLELEMPTPRQAESIEHITRAGQHLLSLINEVLDLARLESGRLPIHAEPVDLRAALQQAGRTAQAAAERQQVRFVLEEPAQEEPPLYVLADPQRLQQVLASILGNAIKHGQAGVLVTLRGGAGQPGRIRISIIYSGANLPPGPLRNLLAPADQNGADGMDGINVGLSLSRALILALNGELGGEHVPGRGSTFWIELPAAASRLESAVVAEAPPPPPRPRSPAAAHKVLYVEDEELNLQLVERVLASHPEYHLITTMQGSATLELAREHRPDLILLDLNLPDISGEVVLAHLKASPDLCDIPVIMVTADVMSDRVERLLAGGALTYLTKPFRISEFLAIIRETLDRLHPL